MKRQDLVKHQEQSIVELKVEIAKLAEQLTETTMKRALAQVKNVRLSKTIRHDIARLSSIIRGLEIKEAASKLTNGSKS